MALSKKSSKCVLLFFMCLAKVAKASGKSKRDLRFPQGTSLSVGVALLSFYPKGPLSEGFLQFTEFDLSYPMSEEIVFSEVENQKKNEGKWTKTKKKFKSTKRNTIEHEKEEILFKIKNAMMKLGYNGSACTSRLQCELRNVSPNNSLIEELIVELFKPAFDIPQKDCEWFTMNCPISLLHIMLHSQKILTV